MTATLLASPTIAVQRAWRAAGPDATLAPLDRSTMPTTCEVPATHGSGYDGNSFDGVAMKRIDPGRLGGMT